MPAWAQQRGGVSGRGCGTTGRSHLCQDGEGVPTPRRVSSVCTDLIIVVCKYYVAQSHSYGEDITGAQELVALVLREIKLDIILKIEGTAQNSKFWKTEVSRGHAVGNLLLASSASWLRA